MRYAAFISYNSKDDQWAKWLQKKLESYKLPSIIMDENGAVLRSYSQNQNRKLRVFRYVTDLVTTSLDQGLRKELDEASYLIVICSPNSARSDWVGKEISHFAATGKKERIIPFIVDGKPYGDSDNECFHPELKRLFARNDLLGIDYRDYGDDPRLFRKQKAVAKTVSLLLDLPDAFNYLWDRYRLAFLRSLILKIALTVLVFSLGCYAIASRRPYTMEVRCFETRENNNLPPISNPLISLNLNNEVKSSTLEDGIATFSNIPRKEVGKPHRLSFNCKNYIPIDTLVKIKRSVTLRIQRDSLVYGMINFRLWNPESEQYLERVHLRINEIDAVSGDSGYVRLFIPYESQRPFYRISSQDCTIIDTILYMPHSGCSYIEAR